MDEEYLQALEEAAYDRGRQAAEPYYRRFHENPTPAVYRRALKDVLPEAARDVLLSGHSLVVSDMESAPALVPFYDVQIVSLCALCARDPDKARRDAAWLEPMVAAGLAIPLLPPELDTIHQSLLAPALRGPWVPFETVHFLGDMYRWVETGKMPCVMCEISECESLQEFNRMVDSLAVPWLIAKWALVAITHNGPDSFKEQMEYLRSLDEEEQNDYLWDASHLGHSLNDMIQAASLGAKQCVAKSELDGVVGRMAQLEGIDSNDRIADLPERVCEAEMRLNVAEHIGIAYDPTCDPGEYVDAVAPYAGRLSNVLSVGELGDDELAAIAMVADEINHSVSRMVHTETRLRTIGTWLDKPAIRAIVVGALLTGVNPWLAACGAGGALIGSALTSSKSTDFGLTSTLPKTVLRLLETFGTYAPGTYSVHDMRKRIGAS